MVELYGIVTAMLSTFHPRELRCLRDDKEELVSQFLFKRVLRLDCDPARRRVFHRHSAPTGTAAVRAYFRRFLVDRLRSAEHRRVALLAEIPDAGEAGLADRSGPVVDHGSMQAERDRPLGELTEAQVRRAARRFVARLTPEERCALGCTFGAPRPGDDGFRPACAEPGCRRNARQLGVAGGTRLSPRAFAASRIGRWIEIDLGLPIHVRHRDSIRRVLEILADEAGEPSDVIQEDEMLRPVRRARTTVACNRTPADRSTGARCGDAEGGVVAGARPLVPDGRNPGASP